MDRHFLQKERRRHAATHLIFLQFPRVLRIHACIWASGESRRGGASGTTAVPILVVTNTWGSGLLNGCRGVAGSTGNVGRACDRRAIETVAALDRIPVVRIRPCAG